MSRLRFAIVIGMTAVLATLLTWQWSRDKDIARCLENGGRWTGGLQARCVRGPPIILRRDLHRA
jgi:hypothetical protein